MISNDRTWQLSDWPRRRYNAERLFGLLAQVHYAQGHLLGLMRNIGMELRDQATLQVLAEEVLKTSEIEGERLNPETVRSSIARRLSVDAGALAPADRYVDGLVDMVLDAMCNFDQPLTDDRLFGWHAALFPAGYNGISNFRTGGWRDDVPGPIQLVCKAMGRGKDYCEVPSTDQLDAQMSEFLHWFNTVLELDPIIKAGLAHLWFVTIHPFDDGNGRIARAVGDMVLAQADRSSQRFYSLSAQIHREQEDYLKQLELAQKNLLDVTDWLEWFLACLLRAIRGADVTLSAVLTKAHFWQHWADAPMNSRQIKLLKHLLNEFDGKLTSGKWATITGCSPDTALRDITDLLQHGVLLKTKTGLISLKPQICSLPKQCTMKS